ncbi:LytTR family DNA-binding domain-containing protein [Algoriphagus sp. SE2]|uniref:LytTR family DNA-binding domain-containing protein n=1 Tax=Algoriphagus sp. SE2 TaxID=3141536 RepID=UPI0031CD3043
MHLSKKIAFTYGWSDQIKVAVICGFAIAFIMIFLQPFDTFQSEFKFKALKLTGYALPVIVPILFIHIFERFYFKKRNNTWILRDEIISITATIILIATAAYGYHAFVFSEAVFSKKIFFQFSLNYSLPFVPILVPLLIYLRFRFGSFTITAKERGGGIIYDIKGNNQEDNLTIASEKFLYAEAQQNYVDIFYLNNESHIQKEMVRSTFSKIVEQLTEAQQVHRSFVVNLKRIKTMKGNSRKKRIVLDGIENEVPVSNKYIESLEDYLKNRP